MAKTANEIQKERIKEIEEKASQLLEKCSVVALASINENGYPRVGAITKVRNNGVSEIYFMTSKRSHVTGKATQFENHTKSSLCYYLDVESVTLIGNVEIVKEMD